MGRLLLPRRGLLRLAAPTLLLPRMARAQVGGLLPLSRGAAAGGGSTWSLIASGAVQGSGSAGSGNSPTFNGATGGPGGVPADLFIMVGQWAGASNQFLPNDTSSNSWSSGTFQAGGQFGQIFYVHNPTVTSSMTVGYTSGAPGTFGSFEYFIFSGSIASGAVLDVQSGSTTATPGSLTPTLPLSLVITACSDQSTTSDSVTGGFGGLKQALFTPGTNYGGAAAYLVTGSAANPTWTSGGGLANTTMAVFKPS